MVQTKLNLGGEVIANVIYLYYEAGQIGCRSASLGGILCLNFAWPDRTVGVQSLGLVILSLVHTNRITTSWIV